MERVYAYLSQAGNLDIRKLYENKRNSGRAIAVKTDGTLPVSGAIYSRNRLVNYALTGGDWPEIFAIPTVC